MNSNSACYPRSKLQGDLIRKQVLISVLQNRKGEIRMQIEERRWLLTLLTALTLALLALPALAAEEKQSSKNKVAVVNGSVITRADFEREIHVAEQRFSRMGKSPSDSQLSAIKQEALERLIGRELLYQESQKKGIKVDEAELNEKFQERFPNGAELKSLLSTMNLTEADLKSQFRLGMMIGKLIDQEFIQKVTVSDKETKQFYDNNPQFFKQPEQVRASHILIKVDSKADKTQKAEARKQLEEIQQKVKEGEDFAAFAKDSSQCPSSAKGGDLGYFGRGQMAKPFEEAAFALKPGEVSDIVETRFGYHLIKVMDKKPEAKIAYNDTEKRIEQRLKNEKIQKEVTLHVEKLKEKAKIERFLSEDAK
jgi:peptidyl-prolyl cis-trans isomerase C